MFQNSPLGPRPERVVRLQELLRHREATISVRMIQRASDRIRVVVQRKISPEQTPRDNIPGKYEAQAEDVCAWFECCFEDEGFVEHESDFAIFAVH